MMMYPLEKPLRTKTPSLRITRWLRVSTVPGSDVPLEAECSACSNARFAVEFDVRETFHQQHRGIYLARLERQFEAHVRTAHPNE
jgi:hypothetical protein